MKATSLIRFGLFGLSTILFQRKKPILGTVILTDKCNLHCKHCSVNNLTAVMYSYKKIRLEMKQLYDMGIRILFFAEGKPFYGRMDKKRCVIWSSRQKRWAF